MLLAVDGMTTQRNNNRCLFSSRQAAFCIHNQTPAVVGLLSIKAKFHYAIWLQPGSKDLPTYSSGQITWASCAVERDVRSSRGSIRASARARPPTKGIISNNSYARDDQGDNPRQETESSTVSSINSDRSSLI